VKSVGGEKFLAHGRDPNFPGWSDTAQLNIRHRGARDALIETLKGIALQCDGVRCDMSMLLLSDVFSRTWGERAKPGDGSPPAEGEFWVAAIDAVRRRNPEFIFIAEAYWGLEPVLQDLGFDYTYDKTLYEKLISDGGWGVRNHLGADLDFQFRSLRFLENHDEPRAAGVLFKDKHRAAALVFSTVPGMRLFHEGQLEGCRVRVPVQIGRRPRDQDLELRDFYRKLLADLGKRIMRRGRWKRLDPRPAWEGNDSWDQFVVHRWEADRQRARLVAVNYGAERAQCYVSVDLAGLRGRRVLLKDLLSGASYERSGDSLKNPGLYLDLGPYEGQLFTLLSL
jgi:hypothetical protein